MIKALLVDDEVKSILNLKRLLEIYCKDVVVIGETTSISSAIEALKKQKPDVLFLDIELGDGSGFNLLKQNEPQEFHVILVTAHNHYAVKAFRYYAIDYLLKPIDVDDLISSIEKVRQNSIPQRTNANANSEMLELRLSGTVIYVDLQDIIRLEAEGSYTRIFLNNNERHFLSYNIGYFAPYLNRNPFFRIHKSHLVNLNYVKRFSSRDGFFVEMKDGTRVEVSRRHKNEFLQTLKQFNSFPNH